MRPSSATPAADDVLAEKYRLVRLIGEGGMSCVFEAVNLLTDRRVAVKWLKPEVAHNSEMLHRFLREARLTCRIEHPNVVQVFDVAKHDDAHFLVMELLQGESLAQALAGRELPISEAIDTMIAVMRGVAEAHGSGVIHRDLKPDNVFLCVDRLGREREPKVLDFGISKLQERDSIESTPEAAHREGQMLGTPCYMAPEQLEGTLDVDVRADVYALGVILYEVLTRRVPFEAETVTGLLTRIIDNRPRPLNELRSEVPPEVDAIVRKALACDPAQRFQTVDELAHALEPFATIRFSQTSNLRLSGTLSSMRPPAELQMPKAVSDEVMPLPVRRAPLAMFIGLGVVAASLLGWWLASDGVH